MKLSNLALHIDGLTIVREDGSPLVEDVSLRVPSGQVTALVGESGSGKTLTALAVMGLLPGGLHQAGGRVFIDGMDLASEDRRELRGRTVSMVFQEPMTALDPVMRIDRQMLESRGRLERLSGAAATQWCHAALASVGIEDTHRVTRSFPHELSGGMRQRVLIAMAMAAEPRLVLADEPTTALDAVNRAGVLDLIASTCVRGNGVLLVTHDLAAVRGWAQEIAVMWRGRLVETGTAAEVLDQPGHPYTAALLECVPKGDSGRLVDVQEAMAAARGSWQVHTVDGPQVPWWPEVECYWGMRAMSENHHVACSLSEPEKCFRT